MSEHTPYNSLLLYHGLGTGKTCSSILIAEETRKYLQKLKINKKIIVVASPAVQTNYKKQLFGTVKTILKCKIVNPEFYNMDVGDIVALEDMHIKAYNVDYSNTAYIDYDLCFKTYINTTGWFDLN